MGKYNYETYPYVALAGKSSKVIIFDAKDMAVVHSIRVLISSMQPFMSLTALPNN